MKITLQVHISNIDGSRAVLHKPVELSFVPMPGMRIEGSPWKGEREVKAVTFSSDAPYDVLVEAADVQSDQEGSVEAYKDNEWKIASGAQVPG